MIIEKRLNDEYTAKWDNESANLTIKDTLLNRFFVLDPIAQVELVRLLEEIVERNLPIGKT